MKPGLIKRFFIYHRIEKLTKKEVELSSELKRKFDMLIDLEGLPPIHKITDELLLIQNKKKKLYLKLL